ncbi:MAG: caspase family protein, partial [Alphaproteobacteria bacterium]|nr:caspase family protein [Alphaproteobacteria bacterium]
MRILGMIALTAVAMLAPSFVQAQAASNPDGVAVIVGNKAYKGRVPAVEYAHNDAEAMKRYVIDVLGFRDGNVIVLKDATKGQLDGTFGTQGNPRGRLANWVRAGESDVVVFYSGHGVPGARDRRGYLLPVDADAETAETAGYPIDVLYENLGKAGARSVTVYLDACFSGDSQAGMLIRSASPVFVKAE